MDLKLKLELSRIKCTSGLNMVKAACRSVARGFDQAGTWYPQPQNWFTVTHHCVCVIQRKCVCHTEKVCVCVSYKESVCVCVLQSIRRMNGM